MSGLSGGSRGGPDHSWRNLGPALFYMLPALARVGAFTYAPFLRAISLSRLIVKRNTFRPAQFVGLSHCLRILNASHRGFSRFINRKLNIS